jgi:hypothetical protein
LLEIEGDAAVAPAILLVAAASATSLVVDAGEHCERRLCGFCVRDRWQRLESSALMFVEDWFVNISGKGVIREWRGWCL